MDGRDLKKYLAGISIAGLVAAGITTVATVQKASAA
jgi:radical SAM modification target selenobiotic family peptide